MKRFLKIFYPIALFAILVSCSESNNYELILTDLGKVARVTGASLENETLPNPNKTDERWNVGATDLGVIWEMSKGRYGVLFGDTVGADFEPVPGGGPGPATDWRSNVLAFSDSDDLDRGIIFSDMYSDSENPGRAKPVIKREDHYSFTYIPTAAIALNGVQYMHYMYWQVDKRDHLEENYSSFMSSDDGGQNWKSCRSQIEFPGDSYFCMVGLAKRNGDPYAYMMGTQSGAGYRKSPAKLARFRHSDILDESKYEYWDGRHWVRGDRNAAAVVLDGTVGELSFAYLEKFGRWLVMYFDSERYAICYRSAKKITGPWSEERVICEGRNPEYSQLYGSYIHPASTTKDADYLYWTISLWRPYNVFLMKAKPELVAPAQ